MSARAYILKPYDCCRLKNSSGACTRKWGPRRRWNLNSARSTQNARNGRPYDDSLFRRSVQLLAGQRWPGGSATVSSATVALFYNSHRRIVSSIFNFSRTMEYSSRTSSHRAKCSHTYQMPFPMFINTWIFICNLSYFKRNDCRCVLA